MKETITPRQKAQQLIEKFRHYAHADFNESYGWNTEQLNENSRQCALMMVDEILSLHMIDVMGRDDKYSEGQFWEEVKAEIPNCKLDELSSMKKITTPIAQIKDELNF